LLHCTSLLLAQSGHFTAESRCPLLGVKRTSLRLTPISGQLDRLPGCTSSAALRRGICQNPSTVLVVFIFVYLGFEHSIANMGTFSMAILGGGALTVNEALHNLLCSTVGNIAGGVLLVGLPFTYLNPLEREEQMQEVA